MLKKLLQTSVLGLAFSLNVNAPGEHHIPQSWNMMYDFELYKNEAYFGGSKEAELKQFVESSKIVLESQRKLAKKNLRNRRVFHAKQHACITGKLRSIDDRPLDTEGLTYQGLFKKDQEFDVLVRFSNGLGLIDHDKKPDFRGLAFKVIDAQEGKNADFLTINTPVGIGEGVAQFIDFTQKVVKYGAVIGTSLYAAANPRAGVGVIKATGLLPYKVRSLTTIHYWGGHPYLLGPDHAMRLVIRPADDQKKSIRQLIRSGRDFLKLDLQEKILEKELVFQVGLQLEVDPESTPIEDNVDAWTEQETPFIHVADLVLERQFVDTQLHRQTCEMARFSPGNYHEDHRPLSNLGRARIMTYHASQKGRNANFSRVTKEDIERLRTKSQEMLDQ